VRFELIFTLLAMNATPTGCNTRSTCCRNEASGSGSAHVAAAAEAVGSCTDRAVAALNKLISAWESISSESSQLIAELMHWTSLP
jgi:hypothetical protein